MCKKIFDINITCLSSDNLCIQATLVNTAETTRVRFFLDLLTDKRKPVMLVGGAGSGKSVLIAEKLGSLPDNYAVTNVPFNFYTTSGKIMLYFW